MLGCLEVSANPKSEAARRVKFKEFLEQVHPAVEVQVLDLGEDGSGEQIRLPKDDMRFYCGHDDCGREQNFSQMGGGIWVKRETTAYYHLFYQCRNCSTSLKLFSLRITAPAWGEQQGLAMKVGEVPGFGIRTMSARFSSFLGASRDQYFKGRRAESQGMGVGAFAYYRRVVDAQREKIFDAIIDVCRTLNAPASLIGDLQGAKKETQFSRAVETIKGALPDALYINGHSPLALLYAALSEGLHNMTDEECLLKAQAIRVVLTELLARVDRLVSDDKELKAAVSALLPKAAGQESKAPESLEKQ
jgi:hypothetical protein